MTSTAVAFATTSSTSSSSSSSSSQPAASYDSYGRYWYDLFMSLNIISHYDIIPIIIEYGRTSYLAMIVDERIDTKPAYVHLWSPTDNTPLPPPVAAVAVAEAAAAAATATAT